MTDLTKGALLACMGFLSGNLLHLLFCEIIPFLIKRGKNKRSKEHSIPSCMLRWCNDSKSNSCPGAGNPAEFAENCCTYCEFYKNNPDGK